MSKPLRVLIVEDSAEDTALILLEITRGGYAPLHQRVDTAKDMHVALEQHAWDLIISDWSMPQFSAPDALKLLQTKGLDLPFLIVSGTVSEEKIVTALKAGAHDYFSKGKLERLPPAIERELREVETRRAHKRAEEKLRLVVEAAPMGIIIVDREGTIQLVNAQTEKLFGYSRSELLGQPMALLIPAHFRQLHQGHQTKFFQTPSQRVMGAGRDLHGRHKDGKEFPVEIGLSPIETTAGVEVMASIIDITERKRAETSLRENEALLGLFIEHAPAALAMFDRDMRYLYASRRWRTDYGLGDRELRDRSHYDVFPEIPERWKEAHRRGLAGEVVKAETDRFERADGSVQWLRWEIRPWLTSPGTVGGIMIFTEEITGQVQAREALQKTSDRLANLIRSSPSGITVLDREGRVQLWNPAAERIFGWQEGEVLGQPLPTVPPDKQEEHRAICRQTLGDSSFTGKELIRRRKDGSLINISLSTAALKDTEGRTIGILGIMADITEHKLMERRASRLEELATLGQLLGGVAHELKNPLFILLGRLQLVLEKLHCQKYDTIEADLRKIEDAAQRMTAITQRFLNFAKPHAAKNERCAINPAVQKTMDFLSNELMKNHIQLVTSLHPALRPVWCDERELQQVFTNLIMNAVYAMAKTRGHGMLTISTILNQDTVEVRIQDDGPGIAPEHHAKLFDPFFTTKPANEGTGLGLWIARSMIIGMKGTIDCETEMGKGTTFIVRLPALPAQESGGRAEEDAMRSDSA